ncbi:MAG TPA: rod shape-determining protein [Verrucomicrobiales bacterium]|nr:rod shape-determining protein [Verrucomicrobiales bacterium]
MNAFRRYSRTSCGSETGIKLLSELSNWLGSGRLIPVNDIAVDLGTANTLIYVKGEGIVLNEPSVVAVERGSRRILGIGLEAKRMLGRTPEGIEAIRPLKDGVIADVDVTEMMLRHFLKQVTSKRIFRIKPTVVVGVPSGITELERRAVRSSAMSAGSKNVFMVDEPMAAAIGVGLPVETPTGNMVIDIGGGTTDYVLYVDGAILASGCIPVGGDHVTNDIHLVTHLPLSKAEQVKKTEGDASGDPTKSEGVVTVADEGGFPDVELKRQIINDVIRMRFQETLELVRERLPDDGLVRVGKGVFLTGGSSQMVGLGELAQDVFGLPVYKPESPDVSGVHAYIKDPQYFTALGLIRYAQILEEERPNSSAWGKVSGFLRSLWPFGG